MPARPRQFHLIAGLALSIAVAGCSSSSPTAVPTPTQAPTGTPATTAAAAIAPTGTLAPTPSPTPGSGVPNFSHIYVIVLENKEYGSIVGSSAAPYLNQLIARYGLATDFYGEAHPSEPNYIALTSGGLQGTDSDGAYDLSAPNLFDQIDTVGRSWHVYAQGYPGNCYQGTQGPSVVDGTGAAGDYARKHNPAISYVSISRNPDRCARITRLDGFDPAAADFEMIVPNQINDMHSSSTQAGDAFLKAFVPQILESAAWANSVLFITWDEGDGSDVQGGGGHIATIVASPGMTPGARFTGPATHYSMLRTIELAWGLPLLGQAASAATLLFPY